MPALQATHAVSGLLSASVVPAAQGTHVRSLVRVGATVWKAPVLQGVDTDVQLAWFVEGWYETLMVHGVQMRSLVGVGGVETYEPAEQLARYEQIWLVTGIVEALNGVLAYCVDVQKLPEAWQTVCSKYIAVAFVMSLRIVPAKFDCSAALNAEQFALTISIVAEALTRHQRPSVPLTAGAGKSTHGAVAIGHGNERHALMSAIASYSEFLLLNSMIPVRGERYGARCQQLRAARTQTQAVGRVRGVHVLPRPAGQRPCVNQQCKPERGARRAQTSKQDSEQQHPRVH